MVGNTHRPSLLRAIMGQSEAVVERVVVGVFGKGVKEIIKRKEKE
jgi:hypothetical protein